MKEFWHIDLLNIKLKICVAPLTTACYMAKIEMPARQVKHPKRMCEKKCVQACILSVHIIFTTKNKKIVNKF